MDWDTVWEQWPAVPLPGALGDRWCPDGWRGPPGEALKALLAAMGWTQAEAAERLGVSLRAVQGWAGERSPMNWASWVFLRDELLRERACDANAAT